MENVFIQKIKKLEGQSIVVEYESLEIKCIIWNKYLNCWTIFNMLGDLHIETTALIKFLDYANIKRIISLNSFLKERGKRI